MSNVIDERVVEMKFDNSKFESNAQTTLSTIDKLKQALRFENASEGINEVSKAAGNLKLDGIGEACETVSAKFTAFQVAAITVLSNITNEAYAAGKKIVSALTIDGAKDGFNEYEQKMGSVQTIMNSTGESLGTVMNYLEELNKYADQTIYSFSDMTTNIGKFTNAGVKLEDAVAAIKGVSNEAAVSGANAQEASRAMYNFAQALSAGYVKLIDWKSIENANMATVEFKNELLNTALALGTVVKEGDEYKTTTTNAKGKVSDLFDATHNFNEALNNQWMTTEVLTQTLAKYADESTDLGKKAYAAAQDVKTFSMMVDTLKEAIGSGWAVTWERFIGDFEHAKKLFTNITNTISDAISEQADARNKFIGDAFNKEGVANTSDWAKLKLSIEGAGADIETLQGIIIQTAKASGVSVDELIEQYGSFEKSLESGWLNSGILEKSLNQAEKLKYVSPEFTALAGAVSSANKPFQELKKSLTDVSGRTHVINGLTNIFRALSAILTPVKEAFRYIFPAKTGDQLKEALQNFEEFTKKLNVSGETAERIKTAFTGFFKVIAKGIDSVKAIGVALSPIGQIIKVLVVNFLEGAEYLGKFFNTLDDGDESVSKFQKILDAIRSKLQYFADNLQTYIDVAKESILKLKDILEESWNTGPLSYVASAIEKVKDALSGFKEGLSDGLKAFFGVMSTHFDGSGLEKVGNVLTKFGEVIKKVAKLIGEAIKPVIDKLKEFFSEMDILDSLAVGLEAGGISAVAGLLYKFVDNIGDLKEQLGVLTSPIETLSGFVQQMGDIFGALEEKIRVSVVKDFAVSVAILAASIYALSTVDAEAARRSLAVVSILVGEVAGIFAALSKLSSVSSTASNPLVAFFQNLGSAITGSIQAATLMATASAIKNIAISVGILALSMKVISDIPIGPMMASLAVISALLWELVGVTAVLSKVEGKLTKGTKALISMAASVIILAEAMKIIAGIDSVKLKDAFLVLTGILVELSIFMAVLGMDPGAKHAGALIALASAILILSGAMKVFETMSWEGMAKGLTAISVLLVELGVALNFMRASLPGAGALIVASGALLILSGALKVLETISWPGIGKGLATIGALLIEFAVGLTAMHMAIPGAIALTVAAAGIAILTPALIALGAVPMKTIASALGKLALAFVTIGTLGAVFGIVAPLIMAFAAALAVLSVAVVGIGAGLALAGVGLTALGTALGLLAEIGKESAERIVDTLQIILNGIISLIPNAIAAFGEGIIGIAKVIASGGPVIKDALNTVVEVIVQVFTENIPALTNAFGKFLLSLAEQTVEYAPRMADAFFSFIEAILGVIVEHIPKLVQAGIEIMVAFIKGIQETQNQLINAAIEAIIAFINGLADSIDKYTPQLIAAVKRLFNSIIDAMLLVLFNGNPKLVAKAKEIMGSFKSGISSRIGEVVNTIADMVSRMVSKVTERVGEFANAGRNMIAGFINGVREKTTEAINAVRDLGGNALNALTSKLKEHSPSRATYEIGSFFDQGFINAVKDGTSDVAKVTSELGETALSEIKDALSDGIDINPTITPVLDLSNIERGSAEISKISDKWDDLSIGSSTNNMATDVSKGFNDLSAMKSAANQNGLDLLRNALTTLGDKSNTMTQNNTFNISGDDPRAIADEISRVLQMQVERRGAVWA